VESVDLLVDAIYEAGLDPERWPDVLDQLAKACGASVADVKMADTIRRRFTMFSAGMDPAAIEAYNRHYYRIDPVSPVVERKAVGALLTDRDLVPREWFTRTEFYNDWVRPQDFADCAVITLFRDRARFGMIYLAAPERAEAFNNESLELLRQLAPHLERAARMTLKIAELDALHNVGLDVLDSLNEGVILADASARIVFANRAAEAMFASADGIGVDGSGLCTASSAQTMVLRRLIAQSARREEAASTGGSLLLDRPSGRRPLSVIVAPIRRETVWHSVAPMAIIFLADPEQGEGLSEARLGALYAMTGAEVKVAGLISKGSGVMGAARALGVAPSTVRTHLHRVFDKTGTRRQAGLAHLINQIALISGILGT
jgi:DNA-binding CsgD family transcriptional regulator